MNWSDEQKFRFQKEIKKWLETAFDEFESAVILLENEKIFHSCQFLQNSVRAIVNCCCILQGNTLPQEHPEYIQRFNEFNQNRNWIKEPLATLPQKILQLETATLKDKKAEREYDLLSEQYKDLLYQIQHQLNKLVKGELATEEDRIRFIKQKKQFKLKLTGLVVLFGFLWGGLYWAYYSIKPLHIFDGQGQVFWSSSIVKDFSEDFQKKFRIKADGKFIDYKISFDDPIQINRIRLDPVGRQIVTVEIDKIELQNEEGKVIYVFNFDPGEPSWARINARAEGTPNGTWKLNPLTHDPFIISETFPEQKTSHIVIKMRLLDHLSFISWLFGVGS